MARERDSSRFLKKFKSLENVENRIILQAIRASRVLSGMLGAVSLLRDGSYHRSIWHAE